MGIICSSPNPEVQITNNTRPSRPRRVVDISLWDKDFPVMTRAELDKKREEFWDTRVEGKAHCWQALRFAAQAEDEATAKAIMSSSGLTPFEIADKAEYSFCYDELGFRYDVPMYVLHLPRNLLVGHVKPTALDAKSTTPAAASAPSSSSSSSAVATLTPAPLDVKASGETKEEKKAEGPATKIKIRLSSGEDISTLVYGSDTMFDMKKRVYLEKGIELERQKLLFQGKVLPDQSLIGAYNIAKGTVLQIFVRPKRAGDGEGPVYEALRQEAANQQQAANASADGLSTPRKPTAQVQPETPMSPISPLPPMSPPAANSQGSGFSAALSSEFANSTVSANDSAPVSTLDQSSSAAAYTVNTSALVAH